MAGNIGEIDVEGVPRGRCLKALCPCSQYSRRLNSVNCNCSHTGHHHAVVVLCRGSTNGEVCDCQQFRSPPAPYLECLNCGHTMSMHNSTGGAGGSGPVGGAGGIIDLDQARSNIRELAAEGRRNDYDKSVASAGNRSVRGGYGTGSGRGGWRPNAGRKGAFDKDKDSEKEKERKKKFKVAPIKVTRNENNQLILTRVDINRLVIMTYPLTISLLKDACRRVFNDLIMVNSTVGSERIFLNLSGSEVTDDADVDFGSCCYYNEAFDSLPKYNSKRQSADFQFIDGGEGSNKGGDGGEWNGNGSDGNDNGDVQVVFENRRKSRNERLEELETVGSEFVESSSKEESGSCVKKKPKQRADELLEIVNAYKITKELGDLILDFQNGDTERVTALLDEVIAFGPERKKIVVDLYLFFAFNVRPGGEGDISDEVYVKLHDFRKDDGPDLSEQVLAIWKAKRDQFHKLANVKFHAGIGKGPRNSYLDVIRREILGPLFEGTDDHLIITAANDLLMEQQYFLGGQFMAHIARHGQHVIAGLSDFTKGRIRGATTDNRFGMEDIPSYDIQVLLRKVVSKGEGELTQDENEELTSLINSSGLRSLHFFRWVAATENSRGYFEIKKGFENYVVEALAHYIVSTKRAEHMRQLIFGFESISKFSKFMELCEGEGGGQVADCLVGAYFPKLNEQSMTKEQISSMMQVNGDDEYLELAVECVDKIVEGLDKNPKSSQSISSFLRLCTACTVLPADTEISLNVADHPSEYYVKFNVCSKSIDVSKRWFESEEKRQEFVNFILAEVRAGHESYTSL